MPMGVLVFDPSAFAKKGTKAPTNRSNSARLT